MRRKGKWLEFIYKLEESIRLNHFLLTEIKASKGFIQKWVKEEKVRVNDRFEANNPFLQKGDRISLDLFKEKEQDVVPQRMEIEILFEDDHLIILNKQAGVNTHPNKPKQTGTLANGLAFYYQSAGESLKTRHIHRLDRDTTGAVIFAKHALSQSILDSHLEKREIKRTYTALVKGRVKKKKDVIAAAIGRDRHHATKRRVSKSGQKAVTRYETLDYFQKEDISIVQLQLDTGRTHQIRVHMSSIGHPIIGDALYGGSSLLMERQALHAAFVRFSHPLTKEKLDIAAPFPEDMSKFVK
ncbi:RluA family pseudouridine synthase [Metabacillus arenae]|uniref:Pseudouridine synthase n=1 Tax=Metabacillus arenae TaxID=2771434 RepID=A0A926RZI4_9BACI|nr:RluA family pseudouridine synthase [Metabacillus arenae]MBD1382292.1 RluA family pseudouridine synthase [Metabacillus arenae]